MAEEWPRTVVRPDATLSVYNWGPPPGAGVPTVLLVHGYPDDHSVFAGVCAALRADCHVVAYDTRNAGASRTDRRQRSAFRLPVLVDDLFAVIAASGAGAVHLVGHDWGSIQGWAAVQDARADGRILSFTSISGPDLGHLQRWFRRRVFRPSLWPQAVGQAIRSSYVAGFQLPVLPELAWRLFLTHRYERRADRSIGDNGARGLSLYRANWYHRQALSAACRIPVQVIVPLRDPFLSPHLVDGLEQWVTALKVIDVNAGHWWHEADAVSAARVLRSWLQTRREDQPPRVEEVRAPIAAEAAGGPLRRRAHATSRSSRT
ncbi:MAG: alpha/beta fold hydrolase [Actinomycetota bacterium]